jgi:cyclopropane-fatty-acyl-phospholipid synthase
MLPTRQIIERQAEAAGLRVLRREFFGASYALTIGAWQERFQNAWPALQALGFDSQFRRMWEYYLAYCRAGFDGGALDVGLYQLGRHHSRHGTGGGT